MAETVEELKKVLEEQAHLREENARLDFEQFSQRVGSAMIEAERVIYGDSPPVAFLSVDHTARILYINRKAEEMFGYEPYELRGKEVELLVPLASREAHINYRNEYLKNPSPRTMGMAIRKDLYGRNKNGTEFAVLIILSPTRREGRLVVNLQCAPLD